MYVEVNGNLDKALKIFNKKVKQAGILQECYRRREYEKPSDARKRKKEDAKRRRIREQNKKKR